jgi:hypothetical protein
MFHCFKIPYFTCKVCTKFTYNEYIGPYFLSHVVLRFSPSDLPEEWQIVLGLHLQLVTLHMRFTITYRIRQTKYNV